MAGMTIRGLRNKYLFLNELTDEEIVVFKQGERYINDIEFKSILDAEIKQRFKEKIAK